MSPVHGPPLAAADLPSRESWRITPLGVKVLATPATFGPCGGGNFRIHILVHEPVSIVTRLGILTPSVALDFWWKHVRAGQDERRPDSDVQVGHHAGRELT